MINTTVLVIEDDKNISDLIKLYCDQEGFRTIVSNNGRQGLDFINTTSPDCVILDIMLPEMDGMEVLRQARRKSTVPILLVTAKIEELDRILGLEMGADDYITKPFSPKELMARIKAILRRTKMDRELEKVDLLKVGDLEIDSEKFVVKKLQNNSTDDSELIALSALEFKLLYILAFSPGQVFSREQLMSRLYDDTEKYVFDRTIDVHIKNLRKKLGDKPKESRYIKSVFGVGYKFIDGG